MDISEFFLNMLIILLSAFVTARTHAGIVSVAAITTFLTPLGMRSLLRGRG